MLRNPIDRIRLLVCKDKGSYHCFYRILGFYPKNIQLYKQALLHKSTSIRSDKGQLINNERLEFLGDAILDAIKRKYANEKITTIDGVKIDFPDYWVHLRKSNTEPIIRIYSEAKDMEQANAIAREIKNVVSEITGKPC